MVHFNPSETAAAALCLSQLVLDGQKWVICLNVRIFLYLPLLHQFVHLLIPPVPVTNPATLLFLWWGPPEACHAAYCQKCGYGQWRALKARGKQFIVLVHGDLVLLNADDAVHLLQTVKKKYSSSRLMKISLLPQLKSSLVKDLAAPLLSSSWGLLCEEWTLKPALYSVSHFGRWAAAF